MEIPYIKAGCYCDKCQKRRRIEDRAARPWWRVVGRAATIILVVVAYLLILWPMVVNTWTYWSTITKGEDSAEVR